MKYRSGRQPAARQQAAVNAKAPKQSHSAASFVDQRASTADHIQMKAMIDASPRQDGARKLAQLTASDHAMANLTPLQGKKIGVKLSINGTQSKSESSAGHNAASQDHRADKGTAGSSIASTTTKSEGGNAVPNTAFGMVSPTHTTTIASAQKTEGNLVVALNHSHHLDVSFSKKPGIDVGTKDAVSSIRKANWDQAKQDLTPDAGGKPPRTKHYSSQYLRDHENNHIVESEAATKQGITAATSTLQGHVITDTDFANKTAMELAEPLRQQAEASIRNADYKDYMGADWGSVIAHASRPGEIRTYAKGKADYQALADKIDAHATEAGWKGGGQHQPHSKKTEDLNTERRRGKK